MRKVKFQIRTENNAYTNENEYEEKKEASCFSSVKILKQLTSSKY